MGIVRFILGAIGSIFLIKGVRLFTGSTDSMLNRGAGFSTGDGTGMNQNEVKQFESGLRGGVLLYLALGAMK